MPCNMEDLLISANAGHPSLATSQAEAGPAAHPRHQGVIRPLVEQPRTGMLNRFGSGLIESLCSWLLMRLAVHVQLMQAVPENNARRGTGWEEVSRSAHHGVGVLHVAL